MSAVAHAMATGEVPVGGYVAVKIQYPDALSMMTQGTWVNALLAKVKVISNWLDWGMAKRVLLDDGLLLFPGSLATAFDSKTT